MMEKYLLDTHFATEELIKLISAEENELVSLEKVFIKQTEKWETLNSEFIRKDLDMDENFTYGQMMNSFYRQAKYSQDVLSNTSNEISKLTNSIDEKKHSIKALSGALLQIAKQGISITWIGYTK